MSAAFFDVTYCRLWQFSTMKIVSHVLIVLFLVSCKENDSPQSGGICISFDDRTISEWHGMRELLKQYNTKVTFFVSQFDSLDSSEITMLKELAMDGHEIGSHGALHVVSENYIKENSFKEYLANEIHSSISSMKQAGFEPSSFAYPYGSKYWFTDFLLLRDFGTLRGVTPLNPERDLSLIDEIYFEFDGDRTVSAIAIDRISGLTSDMIQQGMKRAIEQNEVLLLYGHYPGNVDEKNPYNFDVSLLEYILKEATENNLKSYKMTELIQP